MGNKLAKLIEGYYLHIL